MTAAAVAGAERKSNFFLGFLILRCAPSARRLSAASTRSAGSSTTSSTDGSLPKDEARKQLDFWREEVERP